MIKFLKLALVAIDFGNIVKSKSQSAVPAGPKTWPQSPDQVLKKPNQFFWTIFTWAPHHPPITFKHEGVLQQ